MSPLLESLELDTVSERGEYVVIIGPNRTRVEEATFDLEKEIELRVCPERDWSKEMAKRGSRSGKLSAKEAYNLLQRRKKS